MKTCHLLFAFGLLAMSSTTSADPVFSQQAYLKPFNPGESDNFGDVVDIDGDYAVVGADDEDGSATTVNGPVDDLGDDNGAAYVFVRVAGVWSQQAYLKASVPVVDFGRSVAISGNRILVGAITSTGAPRGLVFVFSRSGVVWTEEAILRHPNPSTNDRFGESLDIDGDTALVGARFEDGSSPGINGPVNNDLLDAGAAYVFVRDDGAWVQQAYLKASNPGSRDAFGEAVSIDGNTAVVTSGNDDDPPSAGVAYVFVRDGATWTQQASVKPSNPDTYEFGCSVGISGDTFVVGAYGEEGSAPGVNGPQNGDFDSAGCAYVYRRTGTTWAQEAYLKASNPSEDDLFGYSVAIDGATVLVGSRLEDGGATGVNGPQNDNVDGSGAAYLFQRRGGVWAQVAYLKASNPGVSDLFGNAVALDGDTALVGADGEDGGASTVNGPDDDLVSAAGAAYVFDLPLVDDPDAPPPPPPVVVPGYLSVVDPGAFPTTRIFRRSATRYLRITNAGGTPVSGLSVSLRGRQAREFLLGPPDKTTLAPGETATVSVVFKPWSRARYLVIGTVRSSAAPVVFSLSGRGR